MIRSEAVIRIQRDLGFRSDKESEIITALQDAQVELEKEAELPWFLLSGELSLVTVSGTETVAVPTGFLRESEKSPLYYYNSAAANTDDIYTALAKDDLVLLRKELPGAGAPQAYDLIDENFYIFPTPDAIYNLRIHAFIADDLLTSNIENQWLKHAHEFIIGIAGRKIASALRDKGAVQIFNAMETRGRDRLRRDILARDDVRRRYQMGGAD